MSAEMKDRSSVIAFPAGDQFCIYSEDDTLANRERHEKVLRGFGCMVFRHVSRYLVENDVIELRTDGWILKSGG